MPIRLRLTLLFALAAALLAAVGGLFVVQELGTGLLTSLDETLSQRITSITTRMDLRGAPLNTAVVEAILGAQAAEGYPAEVANPSAGLAYDNFRPNLPLLPASELRLATRHQVVVDATVPGTAEPLRVHAAPLPGQPGWALVVAASLQSTNAAVAHIRTTVVLGGLVLVVLAGLGAWLLARAALSPMDRLRREADAISASDPAARVQVPRTRDEVAALARTMNDLLQRLQRALARQRAFLADAGHELRTPLAILRAELELAARPGRSREELVRAVGSAADETQRVTRLAEHLLQLARSDEGRLVSPPEPGRLDELLGAAADAVAQPAKGLGVAVATEAPQPLVVPMDAARVRQAVDNLLGNALRLSQAGTTVELCAQVDAAGDQVRVEVRDRGPGFPDDFLPRAFERFSRPGHARARDQGGTGLGLSIVRAIAEGHGGTANAANRPGGGAVVGFTLPLRPGGDGDARDVPMASLRTDPGGAQSATAAPAPAEDMAAPARR